MNAEQTIKVAEFLPVLDQITGFMTEALTALDASQTKVAQLESQLADKDKIILEKVATKAAAPVFKEADVQSTLDRLQEMNIIDSGMSTKLANEIKEDPKVMLGLLTKISEALILDPVREGGGIEKEASADNVNPTDPDGWGDFAAGRRVKLVQ